MFTVFFNQDVLIMVDMLPKGSTITGTYNANTVLSQVVYHLQEIKGSRLQTEKIHLLHDKSSSHKTQLVLDYLAENRIKVLPHPPYSPDLATCGFWLTNRIVESHFNRVQDLAKAVNLKLRGISQNDYHTAFNKWISRLIKCIQSGRAYFEGQ